MQKATTSVVNYQAIQQERLTEIQRSISERLNNAKDSASGDNLRYLVLTRVAQNNYQDAHNEIDRFVSDNWRFPNFQSRVERFRRYSHDLVNAIEAKRSFPGLAALPLAKQQEIYESVIDHFEDLKANLKVIERVEKETKLNDIRSTAWVVKAFAYSVFFVVGSAFLLELNSGLFQSMEAVYTSYVGSFSHMIFRLIGL